MALLEFGAGEDHVHLLVSIHPTLNISTLMNNLKTATARRAQPVSAASRAVLREAVFLAPGLYYVGSVGGASLEGVKQYVASQSQVERPRSRYPPPGWRPGRGMRGTFMFKFLITS